MEGLRGGLSLAGLLSLLLVAGGFALLGFPPFFLKPAFEQD